MIIKSRIVKRDINKDDAIKSIPWNIFQFCLISLKFKTLTNEEIAAKPKKLKAFRLSD